jgi:hypothetical protein
MQLFITAFAKEQHILIGVIGNLELSLLTMDPNFPKRDFIDKAFRAAKRAAKLSTMMLQFVGQTDVEMERFEIWPSCT